MKNKKISKKLSIKILLILIIFLIVILGIVIGFIYHIFDPLIKIFKEPKKVEIIDQCSRIFTDILHKIKTEEECRLNCKNECKLRDMSYFNIEFISKDNDCNTCNCYCK